jgi:DNA (cytosine-5)-methyltransferase 1
VKIEQGFARTPSGKAVKQTLTIDGERFVTTIQSRERPRLSAKPDVAWVQSYLSGQSIEWPAATSRIRVADLFCGSGGLTHGLKLAARSLGVNVEVLLAADSDDQALQLYQANHGAVVPWARNVDELVDFKVDGRGHDATWGTRPSLLDAGLGSLLGELDILVAGPPCQGHSNLNNKTRRKDSRNLLYLTTVAVAVATKAKLCIIENVPDVINDAHDVVETAHALLHKEGYSVDAKVLSADDFGVPQRRRRHFLVAVRGLGYDVDVAQMAEALKASPVTVNDAIKDLAKLRSKDFFDTVSVLSQENVDRINYLHDKDVDDLPDRLRPDCHKDGHTYPSVYGRIRGGEPAQTITTGFLTPGRGRFVHPTERRTITPHEAARLQSFPDGYAFAAPGTPGSRATFAKVIGDAVPPLLGRAVSIIGLTLLRRVGSG